VFAGQASGLRSILTASRKISQPPQDLAGLHVCKNVERVRPIRVCRSKDGYQLQGVARCYTSIPMRLTRAWFSPAPSARLQPTGTKDNAKYVGHGRFEDDKHEHGMTAEHEGGHGRGYQDHHVYHDERQRDGT